MGALGRRARPAHRAVQSLGPHAGHGVRRGGSPLPRDRQLGAAPRGWTLGDVAGVAVDAADNLFVYNRSTRPIQIYDRDGNFLDWWGDDEHTTPHGITIDQAGDIWLADTGDHLVKKCTPDGKLLLAIGRRHINTPEMGGVPFNRPTRVAVAASGDLYVSDGYGNNHVHVFDAGGDHKFTFGSPGTARASSAPRTRSSSTTTSACTSATA